MLQLTYAGTCLHCEAGFFKEDIGNLPCTPCPEHTTSPPGSVLRSACLCVTGMFRDEGGYCVQCSAGSFSETAGATSCDACPANSNSPAGSAEAAACVCNAGSTGPDGGGCALCGAGKFKAGAGSDACSACGAGTWNCWSYCFMKVCDLHYIAVCNTVLLLPASLLLPSPLPPFSPLPHALKCYHRGPWLCMYIMRV